MEPRAASLQQPVLGGGGVGAWQAGVEPGLSEAGPWPAGAGPRIGEVGSELAGAGPWQAGEGSYKAGAGLDRAGRGLGMGRSWTEKGEPGPMWVVQHPAGRWQEGPSGLGSC